MTDETGSMGSEPQAPPPTVSVVIAHYNGAAFIEDTLDSVRRQTIAGLEIIVSDDGSTDGSLPIIRRIAQEDPRIRLLEGYGNSGPAGARNRALAVARGEWIAVVDADDLLHPRRFELLLAAGERDGADIVADNMIAFDDARLAPCVAVLGQRARSAFTIDAPLYIRANALRGKIAALGYLKPMIRREWLSGVRYDETLRIAEDYDLIVRILLRGARFRCYPTPLYFYRRHAQSISFRLSPAKLAPMIEADEAMRRELTEQARMTPELAAAFQERAATLMSSLDFEMLVHALKKRAWGAAATICLRRPRAMVRLAEPFKSAIRRMGGPKRPASGGRPHIYVLGADPQPISEQAGATDNSNAAIGPGDGAVTFIPVRPQPLTMAAEGDEALGLVSQAVAIANAAALAACRIEVLSEELLDWAAFCIQPGAQCILLG
jgi:succinoglycan biosynthesis protein ExoO